MANIKKHIPNFITCCNLLSGCAGVVMAFQGNLVVAAALIWLGAMFDFFDGFVARWLQSYSDIGKELDSLADMVTFGVLPGCILFMLIQMHTDIIWLPFLAFSLTSFSALRLAKFNTDTRQSVDFIGLATPAMAIFVSGLPYIQHETLLIPSTPWLLVVIGFGLSILMVSEITLFSLKIAGLSWKTNWYKYMLLISAIPLMAVWGASALPAIIIIYILLSVFFHKAENSMGHYTKSKNAD